MTSHRHCLRSARLSPTLLGGLAVLAALSGLVACAPTFNWREVSPQGADVAVLLPCRPEQTQRDEVLQEQTLRLDLAWCEAGGALFGFSSVDLRDPAHVPAALQAMQQGFQAGWRAPLRSVGPVAVPGATPQAAAGRWQVQARAGDEPPAARRVAYLQLLARGTRVMQMTVLAPQPLPDELVDTYFNSLRWPVP